MHIVVLGDIHDRFTNLDKVLDDILGNQPAMVICTGDLGTGKVLTHMSHRLEGTEIHTVLGNIDDEADIKGTIDRERLLKVYYHGLIGRLTVEKKHLAFAHKDKDAAPLLEEHRFDAVFYGHSHQASIEQREQTLYVNPGDVQGRFGKPPTYVIYDTDTSQAQLHTVA